MVLLSCSGTGGGIYAKLANRVARHNALGQLKFNFFLITTPANAKKKGQALEPAPT